MNKFCKIVNSKFSWLLIVDGFTISFQGSFAAEYFLNHYTLLGYTVEYQPIYQEEE
jgi:hypothetical protein